MNSVRKNPKQIKKRSNNGQNTKRILGASRRPGTYRRLFSRLAPQADKIYRRHSRKNGWKNAPTVRTGASFRLENTGRDRKGKTGTGGARNKVQTGEQYHRDLGDGRDFTDFFSEITNRANNKT